MIIKTLEQGSQEWHEWRFGLIMASEVPAILGLSPYEYPWNTFENKLHKIIKPPSFIFQKGHEIEAKVRARYELDHSDCPPVCMESGIFGASLDGWNGKQAIEIKYVGKDHIDTIPPHHMAQLQAQMFVTDTDSIIYMPCDGERTVIKEVPRDKIWWKANQLKLKHFHRDLLHELSTLSQTVPTASVLPAQEIVS
jgi:putative phage-type endonuclease